MNPVFPPIALPLHRRRRYPRWSLQVRLQVRADRGPEDDLRRRCAPSRGGEGGVLDRDRVSLCLRRGCPRYDADGGFGLEVIGRAFEGVGWGCVVDSRVWER